MVTLKERTKDELIAAFKEAVNRKKAWENDAQKEFAEMRMRRVALQ